MIAITTSTTIYRVIIAFIAGKVIISWITIEEIIPITTIKLIITYTPIEDIIPIFSINSVKTSITW